MSRVLWAKHAVGVWEERSGDPRLPKWLRVAAYAYGKHAANGHANVKRGTRYEVGTLSLVLADVDTSTGELIYASPDSVRRALDTAVEYGFLAPGSNTSCLIVPAHAVSHDVGNPHERCKVNHVRSRARHDDRLTAPKAAA